MVPTLPRPNIGRNLQTPAYTGAYRDQISLRHTSDKRHWSSLKRIRLKFPTFVARFPSITFGHPLFWKTSPDKSANLSQSTSETQPRQTYKDRRCPGRSKSRRDHSLSSSLAIQRAMRSLCGPLLRAFQLYCPVADGVWLELASHLSTGT